VTANETTESRVSAAREGPGRAPYYSFGRYLRERFGGPVRKVSLRGPFTCPNRDGTLGIGGCLYCNVESFTPPLSSSPQGVTPRNTFGWSRRQSQPEPDWEHEAASVREQLEQALARADSVKRAGSEQVRFISYFQPYTNTYAPAAPLDTLYRAALDHPRVVGLAVSTRPDCVPDEVLCVLEGLARGHGTGEEREIWLELGLQSSRDETLTRLNRGHDAACFADVLRRAAGRGLKLAAHVILGLPGESPEDTDATARFLGELGVDGVKIHHLHVVRGSALEAQWRRGEVRLWTRETFVEATVRFLEWLPPETVIMRLVGEAPDDIYLAPEWGRRKGTLIQAIRRELETRGTRQGRRRG